MREVNTRTQVLRELSSSLGLSDTRVKTNGLRKTCPYWRSQPLGDWNPLHEETVEVVIPPQGNAAMVLNFIVQLEKILDDYDTHGSIIRMVPLRDWGTIITARMKLRKLNCLVERLGNLPEVEEVKEEPSNSPADSISAKRFEFLTKLGTKLDKRIYVTFNGAEKAEKKLATEDTDTAGQELVPVPA